MVNYFIRGLKRIFGIKPKHKKKLAPYGSLTRPKLVYDFSKDKNPNERIEPGEVFVDNPIKKPSKKTKTPVKKTKKKTTKKKSTKKSTKKTSKKSKK